MRITGGIHRSRALRAPAGKETRPTSDRVREALFGILASAGLVDGARVLDLYAGSGALGLEALSRGAASVVLVESSRAALATIRGNVTALGAEAQARIVAGDVGRLTRRIAELGPYELVLADPPWALVDAGEVAPVLSGLVSAGVLAEGGHLVLEHSARTTPPELSGFFRTDSRRYGDSALAFYKVAILGPPRMAVEARSPFD